MMFLRIDLALALRSASDAVLPLIILSPRRLGRHAQPAGPSTGEDMASGRVETEEPEKFFRRSAAGGLLSLRRRMLRGGDSRPLARPGAARRRAEDRAGEQRPQGDEGNPAKFHDGSSFPSVVSRGGE